MQWRPLEDENSTQHCTLIFYTVACLWLGKIQTNFCFNLEDVHISPIHGLK